MKITGWDRWQSYRSDRGAPPWIKVHRNLMSNPEWAVLSDAEKGQIVSIWIVAADKSGSISGDSRILQKICQLDKQPNISKFKDLGFIERDAPQLDANLTPDGRQLDPPDKIRGETEERQRRVEEITIIFAYWKIVMKKGSQTKLTDKRKSKVDDRLEEGYTVETIKQAIDGCARSPHHMGKNDEGTIYDDLELICRAGDKLENFANNIGKVNPTTSNNTGSVMTGVIDEILGTNGSEMGGGTLLEVQSDIPQEMG